MKVLAPLLLLLVFFALLYFAKRFMRFLLHHLICTCEYDVVFKTYLFIYHMYVIQGVNVRRAAGVNGHFRAQTRSDNVL